MTVIDDSRTSIVFNISKRELLTPNAGFKLMQRRLRGGFKTVMYLTLSFAFSAY
jgi:hypothetical protein